MFVSVDRVMAPGRLLGQLASQVRGSSAFPADRPLQPYRDVEAQLTFDILWHLWHSNSHIYIIVVLSSHLKLLHPPLISDH